MFNKNILSIVSVSLFAVTVLTILSGIVSAQGRYANVYSRNQVSSIITRLETSSNNFRRDFDRQMDRTQVDGTTTEVQFNNTVRRFENSLDRLRRNFDRTDTWWQTRSDVQDVINSAQPVNQMMNSISFRRNLERQWNQMRNDINTLADTYDLPGLAGGGWMGGPQGPAGRRGNVPNWAVGTFYARNPQTGGNIQMTVQRDGLVTLNYDDMESNYASMNGTTLTNGPYLSRVTRISGGIRTTDPRNGSFIDYFRNRSNVIGGGPIGPIGGPIAGGNVPDWAVGTFFARNPETGGNIQMIVQRDGTVTLNYDGMQSNYASMNGTTLTNGPYVSRVTPIRNGIRTTDVSNGSFIDYYRRDR